MRTEPPTLASKPLAAPGISVRHAVRLFNAELDVLDGQQAARPYLAEALPRLDTESWRTFPDGTMETRYRLRPNLAWHDGTALSAEDFVFAWRVYTLPALGIGGTAPYSFIHEMAAPEAGSLVIRWNAPFPDAGSFADSFQALPRHILRSVVEQDQIDALTNHAYWTREYVGLGPYRLEQWEPGAYIEAVAYDWHVLGRPKIDRVVVRFSSDENTNLASLLAGDVQIATDRSIRFEQAQVLKERWGTAGGVAILTPGQPRFIFVQLRPEMANPASLVDVRVRRALAHGINRQAINDGLFQGEGTVAETLMPPSTPYFAELDRTITRYAYDPRRVEQLMGDAGLSKDREGLFSTARGERFGLGFMVENGAQNERDMAIMENTWRGAGIDVRPTVMNATQLRDAQLRATFPGLYSTSAGGAERDKLGQGTTAAIPSAANRWTGGNRGAWSNAEYDRLFEQFNTTLDRAQRDQQAIQMLKILSDELPTFMSFFNYYVTANSGDVVGADPTAYDSNVFWNIHEWQMR